MQLGMVGLQPSRAMWMMVPVEQVTERTVRELAQRLDADDGENGGDRVS
jgi:6-phosphogluconate dehydrogenase (decarboxylating)